MPTPKRGNKFFLFVMFSQIFTATVISPLLIYMLSQQDEKINIPFFNTVSQLISFGIPFLIYLALTGKNPGEALPHKKLNFTNIFLILGMVVAIRPLALLISAITSLFFENTISEFMVELYKYPIIVVFIAICIVPAIAEEIILRGVTLDNYDSVDIKKAAFVNGLFFGFLHFNSQQFFYAFFIGFIFSYFVRYTKSIYSSILAHFIFNFAQVAQIYIFISAFGYDRFKEELAAQPATGDIVYSILIQSISAAIMLPVFIILFLAFIRYNVTKNLIDEFLTDIPGYESSEPGTDATYTEAKEPGTDDDVSMAEESTFSPELENQRVFDLTFAAIVVTYVLAMVFIFSF